ncbi:hypothetical protein PCASD_11465 [Puccinia coronata f. sp. avenae]|uniref:Uncharacterized protein n=1 Tax=Puccinia coronata f. sp. avenae TaxID=200324 RepID=A0A2N5V3A9_9BASI|nr:hypothetical protein PCASD_11465 [Puccinia coronata f. sp. avenae]
MVSTRSNKPPATADPSEPQNPTTQDGRGGRGGRSNSSRGRGRGGINTRGRSQSTQSSESSQQQRQSTTPTNFNSASGIPNLTLNNYESQLALWSEKQLSEVLSKQTNQSNRIPPKVQEALRFHKMNYTKLKLMLALIGNVSAKTVKSWLQASADIPVPPKGCPHGWDNCNGDVGKAWRELSKEEKEVFDAKVFQHFSKLPIPDDPDEEDNEDEETDTTQSKLSTEEELLYQPLYNKLVNHKKVKLLLSQEDDGPDPKSKAEKQAINHVTRVNSELLDSLEAVAFPKNYPMILYGLELHKIGGVQKIPLKPTVTDG